MAEHHSNNFPYSDQELEEAGLLGDQASPIIQSLIRLMGALPELRGIPLLALQSLNNMNRARTPSLPASTSSSSSSDTTLQTSLAGLALQPKFAPDHYERTNYYRGIAPPDAHPNLVFRTDHLTTPFPKPSGRFFVQPTKSVYGVHNTPLMRVWDPVGEEIVQILENRKINWTSVDPARFYTHGSTAPVGADGSMGPPIVWIAVAPGSTPADLAYDASRQILQVLHRYEVIYVHVEWREAVFRRLSGPQLLRHAPSVNRTHYLRRVLTPLHGVPLAAASLEHDDAQGTLTLWFHENRDKHGSPSDRVLGVSNCHVLRGDTKVAYEHRGGAPLQRVRICGMRRFQKALDEVTGAMDEETIKSEYYGRQVEHFRVRGMEDLDEEAREEFGDAESRMKASAKAVNELIAFHSESTGSWSDIRAHRDIGYLCYAPAVGVDKSGDIRHMIDWAAFVAAADKCKPAFQGNTIDLGDKWSPSELTKMFYTFDPHVTKYPIGRKLKISGCLSRDDISKMATIDGSGNYTCVVAKDGNTTDLTLGRFAGVESFVRPDVGDVSRELAIYNGFRGSEQFSDHGDSGSLVWTMRDGKALIFGQLHAGENKGNITSNHITYCTPGWFLLDQIKLKFPHADFYRDSW